MADLNTVVKSIQTRFSKPLTDNDMRELGALAAKMIVKRTRAGSGVRNSGGNVVKLKRLSTQYIEFRKRHTLSNTTSPGTSNLTFTGKMLKSIRVTSIKTGIGGKSELIVGPYGGFNIKKAEWVSVDRPFMNLGKTEIKKITELMGKRIRNNVKSR